MPRSIKGEYIMAKAKKTTESNVTITTEVRDFYDRTEVVRAIRWATGLAKSVAEAVYRETCPQFHNIAVADYRVYGTRRSVR